MKRVFGPRHRAELVGFPFPVFLGWLGKELKGAPLALPSQLGGRTSQGYAIYTR